MLIGYLVYVILKGELPTYLDLLRGGGQQGQAVNNTIANGLQSGANFLQNSLNGLLGTNTAPAANSTSNSSQGLYSVLNQISPSTQYINTSPLNGSYDPASVAQSSGNAIGIQNSFINGFNDITF